jgi:hypothetical protein
VPTRISTLGRGDAPPEALLDGTTTLIGHGFTVIVTVPPLQWKIKILH